MLFNNIENNFAKVFFSTKAKQYCQQRASRVLNQQRAKQSL
jgi:hypothetical protein